MLSRVAERMYWTGRYMERAENTARMVNAVTEMILGAPREATALWGVMVEVMGLRAGYAERYGQAEERHVVRFMLPDEHNPSSILRSVQNARENARTTREVIPTEAWELINDTYWQVREQAGKAVARNHRSEFLRDVVERCQLLNGLLSGTMSHDAAYHFARLGRNIERADMTTRVIDLGIAGQEASDTQQQQQSGGAMTTPLTNIRWMSVLLCMSAYEMYHQHVQTRVKSVEVVKYLVLDTDFPRSVMHCLNEVESCLLQFPRHEETLETVQKMRDVIRHRDLARLMKNGLRKHIDTLQRWLAQVHSDVSANWFAFAPRP